MPFSKSTTNYNLPQYEPTDKPKYLTDFNSAMETIDTTMKSISTINHNILASFFEGFTNIDSWESTQEK